MGTVWIAFDDVDFVRESNRIEGINRDPSDAEMVEFYRFINLDVVSVADMVRFVGVYQPNAVLRDRKSVPGVRVGNHIAPASGPNIRSMLEYIIASAHPGGGMTPWEAHTEYEQLHPFTDGNGRSGRMLWRWQMKRTPEIGFLHTFYYQTLAHLSAKHRLLAKKGADDVAAD